VIKDYPLEVFGDHNLLNMEAARLVCEQLGIRYGGFLSRLLPLLKAPRAGWN
jgi:UDP-N-acetylmuramate: L-alanyl-gamma-D-glutamyl-meso-diaminopimelate ligase